MRLQFKPANVSNSFRPSDVSVPYEISVIERLQDEIAIVTPYKTYYMNFSLTEKDFTNLIEDMALISRITKDYSFDLSSYLVSLTTSFTNTKYMEKILKKIYEEREEK